MQQHLPILLQLPGLFDGCQMYLQGTFSRGSPNKLDLTNLLKNGGAHLLSREPRLVNIDEYKTTVPYHANKDGSLVDCGIYIVHDETSKVNSIQAHRLKTVPVSWVIDCISTFSLVEPPLMHQ